MSSSTSSSKKVALYTILLTAITLGSATWLVNAFTDSTEKNAGDVFGIQRIRSVVDSLDYIANTKEPSVIVFGSSLIKDGFSPRYYDKALKNQHDIDITSFNLGLGNMKPSYQLLLAKRMKEAYQRSGKKVDLAIIEFNPFLTTKKRENFRPFMTEQVSAVLMSPEEIHNLAFEDTERYARMLSIRYIRNGVSAEAITGGIRFLVGAAQDQAPSIGKFTEDHLQNLSDRRSIQKQLRDFITQEHPKTKKSHVWNPVTQGGLIDMMDLSSKAKSAAIALSNNMRYPKTLALDAQGRIDCCDIIDLEFSEPLFEDFQNIVKEFKSFSNHVEVILMPSNRTIIPTNKEALDRQEILLKQLEKDEQITVRNYQDHPAFAPSMFYDATHLAMDTGRITFSRLLAQNTVETLKEE